MDSEKWFHSYRKLDRSDPFQQFNSTNYTDPRLKFKRQMLNLLKQLYISGTSND